MSAAQSRNMRVAAGNDYGYCNARIRGMKSRLLDDAFFDRLIGSHEIGQIIHELHDTPYADDLDEALLHGANAGSVDEALRHNMVRDYRTVLHCLNVEGAELVTTLLGWWDLFNIKTVIRGKHMHLSAEEISAGLMPVGQVGHRELEELSRAQDVREAADILATWGGPYASPLRASLGEYQRTNDLSVLELALDRFYAGWASGRMLGGGEDRAIARRVLGAQIDVVNVLTVLRLLKADVPKDQVHRFHLEGGLHISEDLFLKLAALSDIDEVLDRLRSTPYGNTLEDAALAYLRSGSIAVFERALEDHLTRYALSTGRGDPLGVGVAIGYLWAKQNEVTNLRIVVKGSAVGMPEDRVRKELIRV